MDRLIYTALTAMRAQTATQAVTANNLANAQVPGFRRELASLGALWLGGERVGETRVEADAVVRTAVLDVGLVTTTGAPLDIAIDGPGWLAVQAADGSEAYTRRGDLRIAASGVLETGDGHAVLGDGGQPLTIPPGGAATIAPDGSVSAGGIAAGRLKLAAGAPLLKRDDGLFGSAVPLDADSSVRVRPGALEGSNVTTAGSLAELLEQSRGFETSAKLLRLTREIDEGGTRLMRIDG